MIDYKFIELMFIKYNKHLQDVITSIETLIGGYDRQLKELGNLDHKKYGWRILELENKKIEAFKKLGDICPNVDKMNKQMQEIQQTIASNLKK